ncbi:hypothetical protein ACIQVR_31810 [Streptomyces xanthochromogenes]|uniref:hypothetical protein n=1 Tax=Streptomyces xanthochromogenes TaxID=67384 RepID=UPI003824F43A
MYAIKVVLQSSGDAGAAGLQHVRDLEARLRDEAQYGVAHISLVVVSSQLVAMTFVVAPSLREAERLASRAWEAWLTRAWVGSWRIASCQADLLLAVGAAGEQFLRDRGCF